MRWDLIVLGAGPAGGNAALAAAQAGLSVCLIDEQTEPGGQVWRAPVARISTDRDGVPGDGLRTELCASKVALFAGRRVWSVGGHFRVDAVGPDGNEVFEADRLISATGAHERVIPFPGWTLPGVIGLAGATVLLKSHRVVPGSPVVVAGCGPLLAAVAAGVIKAGGTVAAVADLAGRSTWLAALPRLLTRPGQLAEGAGWFGRIAGARVPLLFRHGVRRAEGGERVERVVLGKVDAHGAPMAGPDRSFAVSTLLVGHGLVPGGDVPRQFRAAMRYDLALGGHVPVVDAYGRTSIPGLLAVGDGAGIRGSAAAIEMGRLAGLAAAHDCGRLDPEALCGQETPLRARIAKGAAFSKAMAGMMALRPAQVKAIPADTILCRCEDVSRAEIEVAISNGADDINQLKHFTRCGMGPCQGRMCGDVTQEIMAQALGRPRDAVGQWTARPPLRPATIADLIGTFDYADIPIPNPAPL